MSRSSRHRAAPPSGHGTPHLHLYGRVSHPDQRKGGGMERQIAADYRGFAERFGFAVGNRVYRDDGVSAFHGLNATPHHELGQFIAAVRDGTIPAEDCLLIENYDRLSRQDPWAAIALVSELRALRIHVGRLDRMKLLRHDSDDYGDFFEAAVEFMRGNSESRAKSQRNIAAWDRKRDAARRKGETITGRLPAWIEEKNGRRVAVPAKVALIQRVFELTISHGHQLIVRRFTEENVPTLTGSPRWCRSTINDLLNDRRVLGEFQPRTRDGRAAGDLIPDYYPAIIDPEKWMAARAASLNRRWHRGRQARHVNLFAGILRDAVDGGTYHRTVRLVNGKRNTLLVPTNASEGRTATRSFPLYTLEAALLSQIGELDPTHLEKDSSSSELMNRQNEEACLIAELAEARAFLKEKGFSPTIGDHIAGLEGRLETCRRHLGELTDSNRTTLPEAIQALQKVLFLKFNVKESDQREITPTEQWSNEDRLRLQGLLRRVVEEARLVAAGSGRTRMALVRVAFRGATAPPTANHYFILHEPSQRNQHHHTPGYWQVGQLPPEISQRPLDLTDPKDAWCFLNGVARLTGTRNLSGLSERHPLPEPSETDPL